MRRHVLPLVGAALVSLPAFGDGVPEGDSGTDSLGCTYSFSASNLKWCVNEDGNLQQFESPAGAEHLNFGVRPEGYVLCVNGNLDFVDTAVQDNFMLGPPQLLAGPTSSSVTIRRVSFSGRWTFDQKWTRDTNERDLTLQMTLQNNGATANNVRLVRVIDIDANSATGNFYDAGRYSATFRNVDTVAVTALTLNESPSVEISTVNGITFCDPPGATVPGTAGDPKAYIMYDLGNMTTGKKKIVKIGYRAM